MPQTVVNWGVKLPKLQHLREHHTFWLWLGKIFPDAGNVWSNIIYRMVRCSGFPCQTVCMELLASPSKVGRGRREAPSVTQQLGAATSVASIAAVYLQHGAAMARWARGRQHLVMVGPRDGKALIWSQACGEVVRAGQVNPQRTGSKNWIYGEHLAGIVVYSIVLSWMYLEVKAFYHLFSICFVRMDRPYSKGGGWVHIKSTWEREHQHRKRGFWCPCGSI